MEKDIAEETQPTPELQTSGHIVLPNVQLKYIVFLRFIIWISPAPTCIFILITVHQYLPLKSEFLVPLAICIGTVLLIGICDAFFSKTIVTKDGNLEPSAVLGHSILFFGMQLILIPLVIAFLMVVMFCVGRIMVAF